MSSGKEHVIRDSEEMIDCYIADIIQGGRYTMNTGASTIFINKVEEYRIEIDTENMS